MYLTYLKKNVSLSACYYLFALIFSLVLVMQFEFQGSSISPKHEIFIFSQLAIAAYAIYGCIMWSITIKARFLERLALGTLLILPLLVLTACNQWYLTGGKMNSYKVGVVSLVRGGSSAFFEFPLAVMAWSLMAITIFSIGIKLGAKSQQKVDNPARHRYRSLNVIRLLYAGLSIASTAAYLTYLYPNKAYLYFGKIWEDITHSADLSDLPLSWYLMLFLFYSFGALGFGFLIAYTARYKVHLLSRIVSWARNRYPTTIVFAILTLCGLFIGCLAYIFYVRGTHYIQDTVRRPMMIYWNIKATMVFSVVFLAMLLGLKTRFASEHRAGRMKGVMKFVLTLLSANTLAHQLNGKAETTDIPSLPKKHQSRFLFRNSAGWGLILLSNLILITAFHTTTFSPALHVELIKLRSSARYSQMLTLDDFEDAQQGGWEGEIPELPIIRKSVFFPFPT